MGRSKPRQFLALAHLRHVEPVHFSKRGTRDRRIESHGSDQVGVGLILRKQGGYGGSTLPKHGERAIVRIDAIPPEPAHLRVKTPDDRLIGDLGDKTRGRTSICCIWANRLRYMHLRCDEPGMSLKIRRRCPRGIAIDHRKHVHARRRRAIQRTCPHGVACVYRPLI